MQRQKPVIIPERQMTKRGRGVYQNTCQAAEIQRDTKTSLVIENYPDTIYLWVSDSDKGKERETEDPT